MALTIRSLKFVFCWTHNRWVYFLHNLISKFEGKNVETYDGFIPCIYHFRDVYTQLFGSSYARPASIKRSNSCWKLLRSAQWLSVNFTLGVSIHEKLLLCILSDCRKVIIIMQKNMAKKE